MFIASAFIARRDCDHFGCCRRRYKTRIISSRTTTVSRVFCRVAAYRVPIASARVQRSEMKYKIRILFILLKDSFYFMAHRRAVLDVVSCGGAVQFTWYTITISKLDNSTVLSHFVHTKLTAVAVARAYHQIGPLRFVDRNDVWCRLAANETKQLR